MKEEGGDTVVWDTLKKIAGLGALLLLVSACGDVGGSGQCGGGGETGSCLRIESIQPSNGGDDDTSNVDAFKDLCNAFDVANATSTPVEPKFEKIFDHSAKLTISNHPLPGVNVEDISDVTLNNFAVTYSINRCPTGATCPALDTLQVAPGETFTIKADTEFTIGLPFVPLAAKSQYIALGGSAFEFPSYTGTYTITGTDSFNNPVKVVGSAEFTIGDFDNCD